MVHWDRQSPGIRHDRADRLVDLYASGEQRSYGPLFLQRKMNISNQAFTEGDFSLSISDLQVCEKSHFTEILIILVPVYVHTRRFQVFPERMEISSVMGLFRVKFECSVGKMKLPATVTLSNDNNHSHRITSNGPQVPNEKDFLSVLSVSTASEEDLTVLF